MFADGNDKHYDFAVRSAEAGLVCDDPSLTVQSQMEDSDINVIVARFNLTGRMPDNMRVPDYVDYDGVFDFHSAQMAILRGQNEFMMMPADVRKEFDNDPQKFLEFCSLEENIPRMRELGLAIPAPISDNTPNPANPSPVSGESGNGQNV